MFENRDYQRELAQSLIEADGVEAATEFARANQWDGLLEQIAVLAPEAGRAP